MAFESGKRTTLAKPVSPWDTIIYLASAPAVTIGRLYIKNDAQEERIAYTWVSGNSVTGCSRGLSKTADPLSSWTWLTRVAWCVVKLVLMHDQIADKSVANTRTWNQTITGDLSVGGNATITWTTTAKWITFSGTDNYGLRLKSLTTTQRNALTPTAWDVIYNSTTGTVQTYYGGTWNDNGTSTTPNASDTVTGKVRLSDLAQAIAGTDTEWWDPLVIIPSVLKSITDGILAPLYFGDWADGDVTISSGTTTLTRDMYYNNLTITSPWVLNPNGYRVFVKWTIAGTGTINRNGNNWWNWSNGVAWAAATTLNQWSLNAEIASVAWRAGNNSIWQNWIAGTAATNSLSNVSSVAGGAWGNGGTWSGGSAWASAASTRSNTYNKVFPLQLVHPATSWALTQATGIASSWWWASWSGDWWWFHNWWSWGWSGGNWGLIWIFANTWNFTWICTATWWTGGNWSNAYIVVWWWGNAWGWGWGGWGNGWILLRCYKTLTADCTKTLAWGNWWTWGTALASWTAGTAGQNGNAWVTISITI